MARVIVEPQAAKNVRRLIRSAVESELRVLTFGIGKTERRLRSYERKYKMTSEAFYHRFSQGDLGDDPDKIRWAGECETLKRLQQDYSDLMETELCS